MAAIYVATAIGCAATKPNTNMLQANLDETSIENVLSQYHSNPTTNYKQAATALVSQISIHNPLLALELGKLPEFQDGVSEQETKALEEMVNLYQQMPQKFDDAFKQMYNLGKPDVRKYNSALQAMFWIFEDGKSFEAKEVVQNYSLENLLDKAWYSKSNYKTKGKWLRNEAKKLFNSCTDEGLKKHIKKYSKEHPMLGDELATQYVFQLSREQPDKFTYVFNESKFKISQKREKQRWSDYSQVLDRLNSPETIEYWTRENIFYEDYFGPRKSNSRVFNTKMANCSDTSQFITRLLSRAGYQAGLLDVDYEKANTAESHIVSYYKDNGKYFIIDNGTGWSPGIIFGPFDALYKSHYRIRSTNPF